MLTVHLHIALRGSRVEALHPAGGVPVWELKDWDGGRGQAEGEQQLPADTESKTLFRENMPEI